MKTQIKLLSTILLTLSTLSSVYSQTSNISVSSVLTEPTCNRYADGSITVDATGGIAPYQYFWQNGSNTSTLSDITAGTYTLTVIDATGQSLTTQVTLTEPMPIFVYGVSTNVTQWGLANGTINITSVENASGTWTYDWASSNGLGYNPSTLDQVSLIPNNYKIVVTDENGCQGVGYYTITQPNPTLNPIGLPKPGKFGNNASAKSVNSEINFDMYPNPTDGEVKISIPVDYESNITITKLDNSSVVIDETFNNEIKISNLESGFYLVNVDGITKRLLVK